MKILQLGRSGQLARELIDRAPCRGIELLALSRDEADLSRTETITQALEAVADFDVLVIAAAYTAVDKAENEEALAFRVNADGVAAAAEVCVKRGVPVIHVSTDYVFDGTKSDLYTPDDPVAPVSAYGRTKLAGEKALAKIQPEHVIIRTAWLYSPYGNNFVKTMLRLGTQRDELRIVADQRGCPTSAGDLAEAVLEVAKQCSNKPEPQCWGVFHYGGAGEVTWSEFASTIFELTSGPAAKPKVVPISTEEFPTTAKRPKNSSLDSSKLKKVYGISTRPWRDALKETLEVIEKRQIGELT